MTNGNNPADFAARRQRGPAPGTVPAKEAPSRIGSGVGNFDRNQCGGCVHWKRQPKAGLDVGACMWGPPLAYPIPGPDGRPIGNMLTRPTPKADMEGCDQWDDGADDDGEGEPGEFPAPVQLVAEG